MNESYEFLRLIVERAAGSALLLLIVVTSLGGLRAVAKRLVLSGWLTAIIAACFLWPAIRVAAVKTNAPLRAPLNHLQSPDGLAYSETDDNFPVDIVSMEERSLRFDSIVVSNEVTTIGVSWTPDVLFEGDFIMLYATSDLSVPQWEPIEDVPVRRGQTRATVTLPMSDKRFFKAEATLRPYTQTTDSDNDGVPDVDEELWGTDSQNPDSDGDGISDGDELAYGTDPRDPLNVDTSVTLQDLDGPHYEIVGTNTYMTDYETESVESQPAAMSDDGLPLLISDIEYNESWANP